MLSTHGQLVSENQPEADIISVLPESDDHLHGGCRRIHYEADSYQEDTGVFTIWLEDHAIAHLLRCRLLQNPKVIFAGYKQPHPHEQKIVMRVSVSSGYSVVRVMREVLVNLLEATEKVGKIYEAELTKFHS